MRKQNLGVVEPVLAPLGQPEVLARLQVVGVHLQRALEALLGGGVVAEVELDHAQVVPALGALLIEVHRLHEVFLRLVAVPGLVFDQAAVHPRLGVLGVELQRVHAVNLGGHQIACVERVHRQRVVALGFDVNRGFGGAAGAKQRSGQNQNSRRHLGLLGDL
ncbi:MAG: hypothetical protein QM723_03915 [Myxococcaceae bacterium]